MRVTLVRKGRNRNCLLRLERSMVSKTTSSTLTQTMSPVLVVEAAKAVRYSWRVGLSRVQGKPVQMFGK